MYEKFLGTTLYNKPPKEVLCRILNPSNRQEYGYIVTPNVDHVIKINNDHSIRQLYKHAKLQVCDSRILRLSGKLFGKNLYVYPGSDLTKDLLESTDKHLTIGIIGPSKADFSKLAQLGFNCNLLYIPCPEQFTQGDPSWDQSIMDVCNRNWDFILVCLSFPKQEMFAADLAKAGRKHGIALCVGASVDFLTGNQKRAPRIFQKMSLEWFFRLLSNPKKFFSRYVLGLPQFIGLLIKTKR